MVDLSESRLPTLILSWKADRRSTASLTRTTFVDEQQLRDVQADRERLATPEQREEEERSAEDGNSAVRRIMALGRGSSAVQAGRLTVDLVVLRWVVLPAVTVHLLQRRWVLEGDLTRCLRTFLVVCHCPPASARRMPSHRRSPRCRQISCSTS